MSRGRVAVTREGRGADRLAELLVAEGLDPVVVPLIERSSPADGGEALRRELAAIAPGDWLVVTSPNGAEAVVEAGLDRLPAGARVAAVGPSTAEVMRAAGRTVELVPDRFDAAALAAALVDVGPARALLALSELADDTLATALSGAGWRVERVDAYRIASRSPIGAEVAELARCRAVTLASGSAAAALAPLGLDLPVVCMGRVTAERAAGLGLDVRAVADPSNLEGLVAATIRTLDHLDAVEEEREQ
ncbi:MAG: uroporphyrinogen-III synthase [Actinomycetota bacterium]